MRKSIGGPGKNAGGGEEEGIQEEAMEALDTLRNSAFFRKITGKMRKHLQNTAVGEDEKKHIFNMFQGSGKPEDDWANDTSDLNLDIIAKDRLPIFNRLLSYSFHFIMLTNFILSLVDSFDILMADARLQAQFVAGNYNCLEHVNTGVFFCHLVNIIQGGFSVILIHTRTKKASVIFLAYIFIQILHTMLEFSMILYRLRLPTVSVFKWEAPVFINIIRECFIYLTIIAGVLMAMQRYYDLAGPVPERERRLHAQSYGKRFLNDQIIYRNAPSFLQRKYALRKATAFQIYSVLRSIKEESSTRHKRGQTLHFDPIFTKQHVIKAKTVIENITDREIMQLIKA